MLFSKAKLLCTFSSQAYYRTIDILNDNHIPYDSKVVNQQDASSIGSTRGRVGSLGINQDCQYLYYIYVRNKDLEKAEHLTRQAAR